MDMPGQYVYRKSLQMDTRQYELDLSFLQEGAYLLRISDDRSSATQRFTILR
ncbi:MAG: hypothetical protein KatS3mg031_1051 [Chitinophagales bacterium]|nr:MAG: hypothetical protein KatS3mg031_1051 [Chitinophagales bacterium]